MTSGVRQTLDHDEIIELVRARFDGYKDPSLRTLTPFSKLKEMWAQRGVSLNDTSMSRYIARAFQRGWVEVVRAPGDGPVPTWKRNSKLEKEVKDRFKKHGLREAIAVDMTIAPDRFLANPDDPFYRVLGQVMAEQIAAGFVRDNDVVGVGSGRAVYNTVKFLERHEPLDIKGATLMSLTGSVWSRPDPQKGAGGFLDADFHVALFWRCCRPPTSPVTGGQRDADPPVQPLFISYPLTYPAIDQKGREQTWLGSSKWKERHPTVALLGVGTVSKNHRFWVSSKDDLADPILLPVYGELKKLVDLFKKYTRDGYSPVADTANHLFFVPPPGTVKIPEDKEREIKKAIAAVNKKLLSVQDDQFKEIPNIALVAGSEDKVYAIRELLMNPNYKITLLCTDSATARKILDVP